MVSLETIFQNLKYKSHKFTHHLAIYDKLFFRFRGSEVTVLELGVANGGSIEMWCTYFGPLARVVGLDATDRTAILKDIKADIFVGYQEDKEVLEKIIQRYGAFDIIIDDCSHRSSDQRISFETLYPHLRPEGFYAIEDISVAYAPLEAGYQGGYLSPNSFVEYCKHIIDVRHEPSVVQQKHVLPEAVRTFGVHFYSDLIIVENSLIPVCTPVHGGSISL